MVDVVGAVGQVEKPRSIPVSPLGSTFVTMGEALHVAGEDGVRRAKNWLERTGRVDACWTAYDNKAMLTVQRPGGGERSFDLGGVIKGGDLDGHVFYAEVKKYSEAGAQPDMYKQYLANCYCMLLPNPAKSFEFMWITWHPFSVTKWARLCTAAEVMEAVTDLKDEWLGVGDTVDSDHCALVAERLWLIVLSDQQERLSMSDEMLAEIRRAATLGTKR